MKETVLALVALLSDLKMDTHVLMNLVRQLREPFRKLLLLAFEGECRRIVQGETYQPLEVQVRSPCRSSHRGTGFFCSLFVFAESLEGAAATCRRCSWNMIFTRPTSFGCACVC